MEGLSAIQGFRYLFGRPDPISQLDLHHATLPKEMVA